MRRHLVALLLATGLLGPALAHDPGLSSVDVTLAADRVESVATFAPADIRPLLPALPVDAPLTAEILSPLAAQVLVLIAADEQTVAPTLVEARFDAAGNNVEFRLQYPAASAGESRELRSALLARLAPGHRQYVAVRSPAGELSAEHLLHRGADRLSFTAAASSSSSPAPSFFAFLLLGLEHILVGYDHLLFLGALLLVARDLGSAVRLITCFTVGHSLTLGLATFNLVSISGPLVETLIAASIVYVAVENILRRGEPRGRYLLTFAFGLIHGLGFASVLREMGVAELAGGVAVPLVAFNLGVELGQIAVAAIVLPIFWRLRAHPIWLRRCVPACSAFVALAGIYWLAERVGGIGS